MSILGAKVEQAFVWNVRVLEGVDPPSWEFDRMILDPGAGNGDLITFEKPPYS